MATNLAELKQRQVKESSPLDDLLNRPVRSKFDADAWHVMQERDNQLIRDSVLHGNIIKDYVYEFSIKGTTVTGISVVGARQLACEYKGIKSRIVGSSEKTGAMFVFRQFEPMSISVQNIPELANEPDYYECVLEISDIKSGNSIQVRKKEAKQESRRDGSKYDRPHYDVIAESKAFRNGVLSIIPQDVISEFETRALKSGNGAKEQTIDQRREALIAFATKHGLNVNRQSLQSLTYAELNGLGDAAREGKAAFADACKASGLIAAEVAKDAPEQTGEVSQHVADWLMEIQEAVTLSEVSKLAHEIRKDKRLNDIEGGYVLDALSQRQAQIKGESA